MWVKMRVNRRQTRAILQSLIIAWLFFINSTGRNHGIIRYNWIANTTRWADISRFWVCYQITLFFSLFLFYFRCLAAYEATRKCAHTKTADVQSVIWYLSDSELWQLRLVVCDEMSTNKRNAIINLNCCLLPGRSEASTSRWGRHRTSTRFKWNRKTHGITSTRQNLRHECHRAKRWEGTDQHNRNWLK